METGASSRYKWGPDCKVVARPIDRTRVITGNKKSKNAFFMNSRGRRCSCAALMLEMSQYLSLLFFVCLFLFSSEWREMILLQRNTNAERLWCFNIHRDTTLMNTTSIFCVVSINEVFSPGSKFVSCEYKLLFLQPERWVKRQTLVSSRPFGHRVYLKIHYLLSRYNYLGTRPFLHSRN